VSVSALAILQTRCMNCSSRQFHNRFLCLGPVSIGTVLYMQQVRQPLRSAAVGMYPLLSAMLRARRLLRWRGAASRIRCARTLCLLLITSTCTCLPVYALLQ
jgi:hypothetical protein